MAVIGLGTPFSQARFRVMGAMTIRLGKVKSPMLYEVKSMSDMFVSSSLRIYELLSFKLQIVQMISFVKRWGRMTKNEGGLVEKFRLEAIAVAIARRLIVGSNIEI
jgi:hypothetical protein